MDINVESSPELQRLHLLIWLQSAMGATLFGGLMACCIANREVLAVGILGCAIAWMLSYAPLRSKARAVPQEQRVASPGPPRWALVVLGVGQIVSGSTVLIDPLGLIIVPADILAGVAIALRIATCNGLNLPIEKRPWEIVLVILAFGTVWNFVFPFVAHALGILD